MLKVLIVTSSNVFSDKNTLVDRKYLILNLKIILSLMCHHDYFPAVMRLKFATKQVVIYCERCQKLVKNARLNQTVNRSVG